MAQATERGRDMTAGIGERLRRCGCKTSGCELMRYEAADLIERLTVALERIANIGALDPDERIPQTAGTCSYIARAALKE